MLLRSAAALTVAVLLALLAARAGEDKKGGDMDGTWALEKVVVDGKEVPAEQLAGLKEVIKGTSYTSYQKDKVFGRGTYKFDRTKKPRQVDARIDDGPGKGDTFLAIYKVEGERMTVCAAPPGKERPTEFASAAGSGHILAVYKRAKE
jgi:uncharacterized protein (TIGR03067 family)